MGADAPWSHNRRFALSSHSTIYEALGGAEAIRDLVNRFYPKVQAHPLLGPLFPEDIFPVMEKQILFLTQFFWRSFLVLGRIRASDDAGAPFAVPDHPRKGGCLVGLHVRGACRDFRTGTASEVDDREIVRSRESLRQYRIRSIRPIRRPYRGTAFSN